MIIILGRNTNPLYFTELYLNHPHQVKNINIYLECKIIFQESFEHIPSAH